MEHQDAMRREKDSHLGASGSGDSNEVNVAPAQHGGDVEEEKEGAEMMLRERASERMVPAGWTCLCPTGGDDETGRMADT